jgi:HEAT repeat protein
VARPHQRRLVLAASLLATAIAGACLWAGRDAIRDRWWLWQLDRCPGESRKELIQRLIARKCGAVVPHVLRYYREHPGNFSVGTVLFAYERKVKRLESIGVSAIPYLVRALDGQDERVTEMAWNALWRFGPRAAVALPMILRRLEGDQPQQIGNALSVVASMGSAASEAVPALLGLARHPDQDVRDSLYHTLRSIGSPAAVPAVPLLREALTFEKDEILLRAALALEELDPGREEVVQAAIRALRESKDCFNSEGASLLVRHRPPALEAVPALVERLKTDEDANSIVNIASALDHLAPEEGVAACRSLAAEDDPRRRKAAGYAAAFLKSRADALIPLIIRLSKDADEETASSAAARLGELAAAAREMGPAVDRLIALCRGPEEDGAPYQARYALANIVKLREDRAVAVVESIVRAIEKDGPAPGLLEALGALGPGARAAKPLLERIAASGADLAGPARSALDALDDSWSEDPRNQIWPDPLD